MGYPQSSKKVYSISKYNILIISKLSFNYQVVLNYTVVTGIQNNYSGIINSFIPITIIHLVSFHVITEINRLN